MTTQDASYSKMRDSIVKAALGLAATRPWADVSLNDIAVTAQIDPLLLNSFYPLKEDILAAHARLIDEELEHSFNHSQTGALKDRLFDVLMERFDRLNNHRQAYLSILANVKQDPKTLLLALPVISHSMQRVLLLCGAHDQGLKGCLMLAKLMGVYAYALWVWRDDEHADLPKTMAALDKGLEKIRI
jgi:ubiquinone biosynthesis protein COQ9